MHFPWEKRLWQDVPNYTGCHSSFALLCMNYEFDFNLKKTRIKATVNSNASLVILFTIHHLIFEYLYFISNSTFENASQLLAIYGYKGFYMKRCTGRAGFVIFSIVYSSHIVIWNFWLGFTSFVLWKWKNSLSMQITALVKYLKLHMSLNTTKGINMKKKIRDTNLNFSP